MVKERRSTKALDRELGPVLDFLRTLWAFDHAMGKSSKRMLATLGITAEQRMALRLVGRRPGVAAGELARLLHVDAGTVSAALKRLETKGLLARVRSDDDKRSVGVTLTRKGKAFEVPNELTVEAAVGRALSSSSTREVSAAVKVLERLIVELEKAD